VQNIEIKTPLPDRARVGERLEALGARLAWRREQRDTFFRVPAWYLKLREVREREGELIAYTRAPGSEPRPSDYDIAPVPEPDTLRRALTRSLGVRGVVEKTRTLYLWKHTRIHLDTVRGLGEFLELEAVAKAISLDEAREEADTVIAALELDA